MRSIDLYTAIRAVDDDILERSEDAACERKKKSGWLKWGAAAACLCVIISLSVIILHQDEPELLTTEGHLEIINVELVEWQSNGFKAVVVDIGNSSIFPAGAELTVIFRENNTEIVIDDGSSYGYGEIQTSDIEWPVGSIIEVGFGVYEKYDANRGYENKVYAYHVELAITKEGLIADHSQNLPDKGIPPTEYPDTTIVPGFDLDEPSEPVAP